MRFTRFAAIALALIVIGCCGGGYQRGVFCGKVIDHTPEEVASDFGKPESVASSVPDSPKYVYSHKTFNPDNMNKLDEKTVVEVGKDKTGRIVCTDVSYLRS